MKTTIGHILILTSQACDFIATGKDTGLRAAASDRSELVLHADLGSAPIEYLKEGQRKSALECFTMDDKLIFFDIQVCISITLSACCSYGSHVRSQSKPSAEASARGCREEEL